MPSPVHTQETTPARTRRAIIVLAMLFVVLWIVYGVPLQNLNYDPSFYYAHIRSPVIDGDLYFANEGLPAFLSELRTPTGLVPSIWSAGPALAWAPFFLLAHILTRGANMFGVALAPDGYTPLYLTLCALGSALWGWLGVVGCYQLGRTAANSRVALLAAITVWLASPLFFFMYRIPLYAHAPTVALISLTLSTWLWLQQHTEDQWGWLLSGLLIGLATLMRWQNGLFVALLPFALQFNPLRAQLSSWWGAVRQWMLTGLGILIGFSPQMIVWWHLYAQILSVPQGAGFLNWLRPRLISVLLSSNRGLLIWQPVTLIGLIGLLIYARKRLKLVMGLALVAALQTYLNSIVLDWWGGGGYGPRRFDWLLPIVALGTAVLLDRLWSSTLGRVISLVMCSWLIVYQLALAQAFYYRMLPEQVPFPLEQYDNGLPLPLSFFGVVALTPLRHPAFLVEVYPSAWSAATPTWVTALSTARGASPDTQAMAYAAALLIALCLMLVSIRWLPRLMTAAHRISSSAKILIWASLAWVFAADLMFLLVRTR